MAIEMDVNGIWLRREDFDGSLLDEVAFTIAFACGVKCRDKAAMQEMVRGFAADIVDTIGRRRGEEAG